MIKSPGPKLISTELWITPSQLLPPPGAQLQPNHWREQLLSSGMLGTLNVLLAVCACLLSYPSHTCVPFWMFDQLLMLTQPLYSACGSLISPPGPHYARASIEHFLGPPKHEQLLGHFPAHREQRLELPQTQRESKPYREPKKSCFSLFLPLATPSH